jgi:hypothetical protein
MVRIIVIALLVFAGSALAGIFVLTSRGYLPASASPSLRIETNDGMDLSNLHVGQMSGFHIAVETYNAPVTRLVLRIRYLQRWASLGIPGGDLGRNPCDEDYPPQILRRTRTSLFVDFGTSASSCDLYLWFTPRRSGKERASISAFSGSIGLPPVTLHPLPSVTADWYGAVKRGQD